MLAHDELDEAALEKLAWLIAEEFVDTCGLLSGLDKACSKPACSQRVRSRPSAKPKAAGEFRMVMHWSVRSSHA